jgi:hypothetical protein
MMIASASPDYPSRTISNGDAHAVPEQDGAQTHS